MIKIKRVYDKPSKDDGVRILVDRLWPRGLSKKEAKIDIWLKDIASSDELRKWFGHKEERWEEFRKKYILEIKNKLSLIKPFIKYLEKEHKVITLVYGAQNKEHNNAVVLKSLL